MSTIRENINPEAWQRIVERFPDQFEGTIATPADIRDRMTYQFDRYLELDNRGKLSLQYRRFGKKHSEEIWRRRDQLIKESGEPSFFRQKER